MNDRQTRANTYRCSVCGGGIVLHDASGGPYGCPLSREDLAEMMGLNAEQAARGWDNGR